MEIKSFVDIAYSDVDGNILLLNIFRPADDEIYPVIYHVHGGGWCVGARAGYEAFACYVNLGYVVVDIDYRLAPAFPYPAACEDVSTAARWIVEHIGEYGGDPDRIGGLGYSAGGHLLALHATEPQTPLKCVVCWGNPTDLLREPLTYPYRGYAWAFMCASPGENPELYTKASPASNLSAQTPPILHIHGTDDALVPLHHAYLLAESAARVMAPVELLILQNGGHCVAANDEDAKKTDSAIRNFLYKHLKL